MDLSLVIPAYEEARRIGSTLAAVEEFLQHSDFLCEVVVVVDGGTDDTLRIAEQFVEREGTSGTYRTLKLPQNLGKGIAVRRGVEAAVGDIIAFTDADLPFGMEAVARARAVLMEDPKVDMVLGDRNAAGSKPATSPPLARQVAGRVFSWLVRGIVNTGISDTQCGLKVFRAPVARALFARTTIPGFGFDVELIHIARLNSLQIERIAVQLHQHEGSQVRLLADSTKMLLDLFRIRINGMRKLYGFTETQHGDRH